MTWDRKMLFLFIVRYLSRKKTPSMLAVASPTATLRELGCASGSHRRVRLHLTGVRGLE